MFPFSGGLNGDDPIPDEEFEELFDDEVEIGDEDDAPFNLGSGMSREDLGGDKVWSDGYDD